LERLGQYCNVMYFVGTLCRTRTRNKAEQRQAGLRSSLLASECLVKMDHPCGLREREKEKKDSEGESKILYSMGARTNDRELGSSVFPLFGL
jgi:hypothetical protein